MKIHKNMKKEGEGISLHYKTYEEHNKGSWYSLKALGNYVLEAFILQNTSGWIENFLSKQS